MSKQEDLELDAEGHTAKATEPVRRTNIALKLKTVEPPPAPPRSEQPPKKRKIRTKQIDTFPVLNGGKELVWNHKPVLIGKKVESPNIHICEKCNHPVFVYGRLKRCKHSFCLNCTVKSSGKCPRCGEQNEDHEKGEMGSVYVCSFGGRRYGHSGCRRSYLSQRDLQAHIRYRHEGGHEKMQAAAQPQPPMQAMAFPGQIAPPPPPPLSVMHSQRPPFFQQGFPGAGMDPGMDPGMYPGPPAGLPFPGAGPGPNIPHMLRPGPRPPPPPPPFPPPFVDPAQSQPPFFP